MSLLGLDIGTSGCKATIVNYKGAVIGQAHREYHLINPGPGLEELDPEIVWRSVKAVISESILNYCSDPVVAVSVSSFGEAAIPVGNDGRVLHNAIIYIDKRGQEEAAFLSSALGDEKIQAITGVPAHSMFSISKIMWIKKNLPEVFKKTWKFMAFADFILFRLGADPHMDYSLAGRTQAFDIINKEWSSDILNCADVKTEIFGTPVQSGTVVGTISKTIASELNLPDNIILVAGGHDQPCAALGAGVIRSDLAVDGLGSTECITPAFNRPVISSKTAESSFACVPHVVKDMYVTYAFTFTSGSVLKWYRDSFGKLHNNSVNQSYGDLIEAAAKTPSDIFILPHFAGAATPYMDTDSRGAIVGLTINTKPEEILRAILEGITYEIMVNVERLDEAGIHVNELRAVGGLSKSDTFLQIKADIMGREVSTLEISEAGTLGVAILAGTAAGIYSSIKEAVNQLVKKKKVFYPNESMNSIYKDKFQTYKKIYPSVRPIF